MPLLTPALTAVLAASAVTVALVSPTVRPTTDSVPATATAVATVAATPVAAAMDSTGSRATGSPGTTVPGWSAAGPAGSLAPERHTAPSSRWTRTLVQLAEGLRPPSATDSVGPTARGLPGTHRPPVEDPVVVARFRAPPQPWSPGHRGVDLRVDVGAAVTATAPGVVTFSGTVVDRGVITVTHPGGLRTSLEPVSATVPAGTVVAEGDMLGTVHAGASHCRPVCLHWGVRQGGTYVDPLRLLPAAGPVVLLPER